MVRLPSKLLSTELRRRPSSPDKASHFPDDRLFGFVTMDAHPLEHRQACHRTDERDRHDVSSALGNNPITFQPAEPGLEPCDQLVQRRFWIALNEVLVAELRMGDQG